MSTTGVAAEGAVVLLAGSGLVMAGLCREISGAAGDNKDSCVPPWIGLVVSFCSIWHGPPFMNTIGVASLGSHVRNS